MCSYNRSNNGIPRPLKVLAFIAMGAVFFFILGNVIMFLWNQVLATVTDIRTINFWQALGLFALARILFGSLHFGRRHKHWRKKRWREKWGNMSDTERKVFKEKWRDWCGKE